MKNSADAIAVMNGRISDAALHGEYCRVTYVGLARIRVHSVEPLVYDKFGLIRNRGPHLAGRFALAGFMAHVSEDRSVVYPYAVLDANSALYGVLASTALLNQVSRAIGLEINWAPNG